MSVQQEEMEGLVHVAVDVGGTFTDVCVVDTANGELRVAKTPSTEDPIDGVLQGIGEAGVELPRVVRFAHGTTVATNALLTRRLPRAGMVTTAGFRDVLEIRRGTRDDLWDTYKEVAPPYVRRRDRLGVPERINFDGSILEDLDEAEARKVSRLLRKRKIAAVAVCFMNSFMNPSHEQRMKEILEEELPDAFITTSSDTLPEMFEHERFSTTVANAILSPVVGRYVRRLDESLRERGHAGSLLVLHCGGGVMTPDGAERYAARLASSGIAAGAIAARHIANVCGYDHAIGLDMGGTSADISLVYDGQLRMTREWSVEYGYPIRFPSIDVSTIGAGGGSLAWIDDGGSLRNGPQSAGASPGPACYGRGGSEPTNSDANLVLGRLGTSLVGGAMTLDEEAAEQAIRETVADPLGVTVEEGANAILHVANTNMANAVRLISVGRGYDPRDFALIAFGGAGGLHAVSVAHELSIPTVVVPPHPGITSALGCLLVDVQHDFTNMYLARADQIDADDLADAFVDLEAQAREALASEGVAESDMSLERAVDMRYVGQWRSITVSVPDRLESLDPILAAFQAEYEREHRYRSDDAAVEIYQVHVTAVGRTQKPRMPHRELGSEEPVPASHRRVVFDDGTACDDTPVYWRPTLLPGAHLEGPAIVEQLDATTVIPPGSTANVDEFFNIKITV